MEYRYAPKPQNKKASILVSSLAALSLLTIVFSMTEWGPESLWQSAFLIFVSFSMFFWFRYFAMKYLYTVTDDYGVPMLIVTSVQGKRISTLCCVELYRLSEIERVENAESEEGKAMLARFKSTAAKYSYMATLFPKSFQVLFGSEDGRSFAVRIEADEAFLSALTEACEKAKLEKKREEEADE